MSHSSPSVEQRLAAYRSVLDGAVTDNTPHRGPAAVGTDGDVDACLIEVDQAPRDPPRRRRPLAAAALIALVLGLGIPLTAHLVTSSNEPNVRRGASATSDPATTEPPTCAQALGTAVTELPPVRLDDTHTLCFTRDGQPPDVQTTFYVNGEQVAASLSDASSWPGRDCMTYWSTGTMADGTPWLLGFLPPATTSASIRAQDGTTQQVPLLGDDTIQQYVFVLGLGADAQVIAGPLRPPLPSGTDSAARCP
jgi:hypothetical protein